MFNIKLVSIHLVFNSNYLYNNKCTFKQKLNGKLTQKLKLKKYKSLISNLSIQNLNSNNTKLCHKYISYNILYEKEISLSFLI